MSSGTQRIRTRRQRNREGSIYPTAVTVKGKTYTYWTVARTLGYFNGKQRRESYRFKTEQEARRKLAEILRETPKQAGPNLKMEQYLKQWLADKLDLKPRTAERYGAVCEHHLIPNLGHIRLTVLAPDDVQGMINQLQKAGKISAGTIVMVRAVLKSALNDAMGKRYVTYNAAQSVSLPRVPKFKGRVLRDAEEVNRLFTAINGDRQGPLFTVILGLGLRKGEALGLTWDRIDFERGTVVIDQQLAYLKVEGVEHKQAQLVETKTSTTRTLQLPSSIAAVLLEHQRQQKKDALRAGWRNQKGFVFTTSVGTPCYGQDVTRDFKRYLEKAGLPKNIRVHDLRGSAASFFEDLGYSAKMAQVTLGHSDVLTTLKYYTQVRDERQREALEKLALLIPHPA